MKCGIKFNTKSRLLSMNLRKSGALALGFCVVLALVSFAFKEHLRIPDLITIINAVIIGAAGLYFGKYARDIFDADPTPSFVKSLPGIAGKIAIFAAFMLFLKHGLELYRESMTMTGTVFFTAGMSGLLGCFYSFDDDKKQFDISPGQYAPLSGKSLLYKSVIAALLGGLGVYFIGANQAGLAVITYIFLAAQLLLILKFTPAAARTAETTAGTAELKASAKIFSLILMAAALYIYYHSLTDLRNFDIKTSIILFFTGALLFGWVGAGPSYDVLRSEEKGPYFLTSYFPSCFLRPVRQFSATNSWTFRPESTATRP